MSTPSRELMGGTPPWHCSRHHLMDTVSDELALACRGARVVIVDAAGAGLAARRDQFLPADAAPGGAGPADVRYVVEPRPPGWNGSASGYRVLRDGRVRWLGGSVDRLVTWLRADLVATVAWRGADALTVRAAAVVWRGRAILIAGRERSGTSSLVAELVRLGAVRHADGSVSLDPDGRIRSRDAAPLQVGLAVSTTYQPEMSWQPRRLRGAQAVLPVIDCALPTGDEPRRILRRCAHLSPTLVTLQGPRPDAAIVAPRILAALDELLDDGPTRRHLPAPLARAQRALMRNRSA
jgi:hypothetical protein